MSTLIPSRSRRRTVLLIGAAGGLLLAATGAVALVSGLSIADQPGDSLDVPALVVEVGPSPHPAAPISSSTPAPVASATPSPESPELVPAPTPVVIDDGDDDHGGNRPDDGSD
ncbi:MULTISPECIES: hypothetical protein [Cryobacterium]|uniref:Small secreted hydrophilic protein n=1 Tax=Cryobacterium breve TaxID=1259258 RepID=A0ABY2J0D3_9MICO|nr:MULTISPECIES: hypothetical protein [Cryobacterium]TFC93907.1 hypothetical protein E3T20_09635 [Cryobacterium sp. TmT3-12]TFC97645.1 hypothetical protein E3O65_12880 [Cryobacterium breve]